MKNMMFLPSPSSISYMWNAGSLLAMSLVIQLATGLIISFSYNSSIEMAFDSVSRLMRSVDYGWMIRLLHVNGASMYFLMMYIHIFRNLMFMSWKFKKTWLAGMTIYVLSMMTAFLGYILPWGQMSFWAATVITNLMTAIPMVGETLVTMIWGGFAVSAPTLNRFFSLHFIMPFVITTMVMIHILMLHQTGSSNPIKISLNKDKIPFHPYFTFKDIMGMSITLLTYIILTLAMPFISMDSDNFMTANPMVTPEHIQPEWYFLFAYSILRAVPNKMGGVVAMMMSIIIMFSKVMKPNTNKFPYSMNHKMLMSTMTTSFIMLTFLGSCAAELPFTLMMQMFSYLYFTSLLMM